MDCDRIATDFNMKRQEKAKLRNITSKVTEASPSFLMNVVLDFGTQA